MSITLPEGIQLPQQSPLAQLLGGLGTGIAKGAKTTLAAKLKAQQTGLTPYQAIQTKLRKQEQQRKIESGMTQTLLKLAEEGIIQEQNVIPMSKSASNLARKGMNPAEALEQGVSDFQFQSSAIDDLDIGKYSARKAESMKKGIINSLKAENIKNPTLINRTLKDKKWPTKERQDILKRLKGIKKEEPLEKKVKFNPKNAAHRMKRAEALTKAKNDRKLANKILAQEFIL